MQKSLLRSLFHGTGDQHQLLRSQPAVGGNEWPCLVGTNDEKRAGIAENIAIRAGECLGHMTSLMQAGVDRFLDDEDLGALGGSLQRQLVSTDR